MKKTSSPTLDIMLDLETLGTGNNPVIIQLAAVAFDIATGECLGNYNVLVSPQSCSRAGLTITGDTVQWWLRQDDAVVKNILIASMSQGIELKKVLEDFSLWIRDIKDKHNKKYVEIWGNGALADNKWIISAYEACNLPVPWKYYEDRDVRTLVALGKRILNIDPKKNIPFEGKPHDAIDDCKHQIKYCHEIYKSISQLVPKKETKGESNE